MHAAHQIQLTVTRDALWRGMRSTSEDLILKAKARAWQLLRSGQSAHVIITTSDGAVVAFLEREDGGDMVHVVDHYAETDAWLDVPIKRAA